MERKQYLLDLSPSAAALAAGADYLVIGRPITAAPAASGGAVAAVERIVAELGG